MTTELKLAAAGFQVQLCPDQPARWGVTPDVCKRQTRFRKFIHETISCAPDAPGLLPARLVALDGIKPSHLEYITSQSSLPYGTEQGTVIDWLAQEPVRTERRLLSLLTLKAWPSPPLEMAGPCISPYAQPSSSLCTDLQQFLARSESYRRERSAPKELELDAICWWHDVLPNVLFAHCCEVLVLSGLPRSALARQESKLALASVGASNDLLTDAGVASELIDAALISHGPDSSTAVADTVLDILKEQVSEVDGLNKRHWAAEIQKLTNRALRAGPRTALLLAWAAELCESGTMNQINPADSTVRAYIRRALLPLHAVLCTLSDDLERSDWSAANLRIRYQELIARQTLGNQQTMRAALSNFHHFLVDSLDIEPLSHALSGVPESGIVRAQIVWPHELSLAMQWAVEHQDRIMCQAARLILCIAAEAPVRAQEVMRLRLCNVCISKTPQGRFAEIEVARQATTGRLKTHTSQRRLIVRSEETLKLLEVWLATREGQGAPIDGFLFGDPSNDSQRYRPAATIALVSRLLKTVTGEPTISLHTLRHTAISNLMREVWLNPPEIDINRIEVVAAHAGHASGLTTLRTYSHVYELALRTGLDNALRQDVELSSLVAAPLLGLRPDALRQQASRARKDINNLAWSVLQQPTTFLSASRVSLEFLWRAPNRPENVSQADKQLTVCVVESVLNDILRGLTLPTVARRYGWNEAAVEAMISQLITTNSEQARRIFPDKAAKRVAPILTVAGSLSALGIDFDRRKQTKHLALVGGLDGNVDDAGLRRGLTSWERCNRGTYLALDRPQDALGLLSLLKLCNVDPNALRVCIQSAGASKTPCNGDELATAATSAMPAPVNHNTTLLRAKIEQVFTAVFPLTPRIVLVHPNRNRPDAYLQWDSEDTVEAAGAAGGSTAGLSAMMVCVRAYLIHKGIL